MALISQSVIIILLSHYLDGTLALPSFKLNRKCLLNLVESERLITSKTENKSSKNRLRFGRTHEPVVAY